VLRTMHTGKAYVHLTADLIDPTYRHILSSLENRQDIPQKWLCHAEVGCCTPSLCVECKDVDSFHSGLRHAAHLTAGSQTAYSSGAPMPGKMGCLSSAESVAITKSIHSDSGEDQQKPRDNQ